MMKYLCILCALLLFKAGYAQKIVLQDNGKPVPKVGEKMPDVVLAKLINYKQDAVKISEFKGKWLVLDFWATWCAPCVASFPKLQHLEQQYRDKLQFISVTKESLEVVNKCFERAGKLKLDYANTKPAICHSDTVLHQIFKPGMVPRYVWIDPEGAIQHIISVLTEDIVESILKGRPIPVNNTVDVPPTRFVGAKPLFVNGNGGNGNEISDYYVFGKRIPNAMGYTLIVSNNRQGFRINAVNADIMSLYRMAYNTTEDTTKGYAINIMHKGRIIYDLIDSGKYQYNFKQYSDTTQEYVYQRIFKKPIAHSGLQKIMQDDLHRLFGLKVRWEKRKVACLVLSGKGNESIFSKGGKTTCGVYDTWFVLSNADTKKLIQGLMYGPYFNSSYPLIDESTINHPIDLRVEGNIGKPEILDSLLSAHGLSFKLEEREINMMIISDR